MIVLVTGSRHWTDYDTIYKRLSQCPEGTTVIQGGAIGADLLAAVAARELGFEVLVFPANWAALGKKAGPLRNREMLDWLQNYPDPDKHVIAFHPYIDQSKGTKDCVKQARQFGFTPEIIKNAESLADQRPREHLFQE